MSGFSWEPGQSAPIERTKADPSAIAKAAELAARGVLAERKAKKKRTKKVEQDEVPIEYSEEEGE